MTALVLIDLQNDFMPGGALAAPKGDETVPVANRLLQEYELAIATQDWHPAGHGSFASSHPGKEPGDVIDLDGVEQILWPDHCVQGEPGAEFHPQLQLEPLARIFQKGVDPRVDSYSAFFDNARRRATGLADYLRERGVDEVHLMGLATDYCVKYSALDAVSLGFRTVVLKAGCRGIDLQPGDVAKAYEEMRRAGAELRG